MGRTVAMRVYQRALDTVEGLVVARLFELGSMNRAGMGKSAFFYTECIQLIKYLPGYKRRRHLGQALTTRSAAIRTAVERYNVAALALSPPREILDIKEVVEYAFLADFDLLRDTRQDVRERPWATPVGRTAMDQYFKLLRAPEEIVRCNNEIRRIVTQLRDEEDYLKHHEERVRVTDPILAHQITIHRNIRGRFAAHHHQRLSDIAGLTGFSGCLQPGTGLDMGPGGSASWRPSATNNTGLAAPTPVGRGLAPTNEEAELEGEQEDDEDQAEDDEDEADLLAVIMHMDQVTITAS